MSTPTEPPGLLHLRASRDRVAALRDAGALSPEAAEAAFELLDAPPSPPAWMAAVRLSTLVLGVGLLTSSVIYGIAWNWAEIGYLSRITGVAALVAAAGGVSAWAGPDRPAGRVSAIAAMILVGPLLGMVGMAYQTGANPWELFAAWVALGLPFAAASRSGVGWALLVLIGDVALTTWWDQIGHPGWGDGQAYQQAITLAALHLGVAAGLRFLHDRGWPEGARHLGANALVTMAWFGWAWLVAAWIFARHRTGMDVAVAAFTLAWLGYSAARLVRREALDAALASVAIIGWTACLLWDVLDPGRDAFLVALFIGMVSVVEAVGLAMLIRPYAREAS